MTVDDAKNLLGWTRERFVKTLTALPDEFLDFKPDCPIPKSERYNKPRGILNHIGWVESYWVHEKMNKQPLDKSHWDFKGKGIVEILEMFEIIRSKTIIWLDGLDDKNLDRPYSKRARKHISFIIYHVAEHEAHHLGQICLLTTLAGIKIPWA